MSRIIFSLAIAIHGIIHLMGFAKEWNLGPDGRFAGRTIVHLSENTSKFVGVLWFITCVMLLVSSYAYYVRKDWFWIVGIAGLTISQLLIILYWPDAKWGTIGNVILLFFILFAAGRFQFDRMVKQEMHGLVASSSDDNLLISEQEITALPNVVRTWLRKSDVIGRPMPSNIHIIQKGSMRTTKDAEWMPFDAEQFFTIDPPAFVWRATIHTDNLVDIVGRDKYEYGKGNMLIKVASLIPIANSSGKEIDQGTMIRFMAEIIWFPQAAVSDYLDWEEIDSTHARVTMSYNDVTASGIYTFNEDGLPISFEAERYGEFEGKFRKETWSIAIKSYKSLNGISIGNKCEATWKLKDGDFTWLKLEIMEIE